MKNLTHTLCVVLTGIFVSSSLSISVVAENLSADHASDNSPHAHHEHQSQGLSLNHGEKWQADEPLRQGMSRINLVAINASVAFHDNSLSQVNAKKLAKQISKQVDFLVANCKLKPEADATLHILIGKLLAAANELSKEPLSHQGLPAIIQTLQLYLQYFDHPGWQIQHSSKAKK